MIENFKYKRPIEVRWNDLDSLRHVNNAVYLTYYEIVRSGYFNDNFHWDWYKNGIILARAEVDFKLPILITDKPMAYARCTAIGKKSLSLEYLLTIEREGREVIASTGKSVLVMYSYLNGNTFDVPADVREMLEKFEGVTL